MMSAGSPVRRREGHDATDTQNNPHRKTDLPRAAMRSSRHGDQRRP